MGTLARRLAIVEEQTRRLRDLSHKMSYEDFSSDEDVQMVVERRLHLCLEAPDRRRLAASLVDGSGEADRYRDLSGVLVRLGVFSGEEGGLFERMVSFRNVLVHLYADLSSATVYKALGRVDELATILPALPSSFKRRGWTHD